MIERLINEFGLQGVEGNFRPASPAEISDLESKLGTSLPTSYKAFLTSCGASLFEKDVGFVSLNPSPWVSNGMQTVDLLYGISDEPGFDVGSINARLGPDLPQGTIAIGHDPGSNLILLSLDSGGVHFFDKDTAKTYLIARDFDGFLKSFRLREG